MRPTHVFPSTKDILRNIEPEAKVFAKVDCTHGYYQIPLAEESRHYTTFLLESGRYRYKKAVMGLNSSSDEFCYRSDKAFAGHKGTMKIVDDGITGGRGLEHLEQRLTKLLDDCREQNITLSKRKFFIGSSVHFAGHIVSADGVKPDPNKLMSLRQFPKPRNVTELRSFLGLVNQLGVFLPDIAHLTSDLRELLQKNTAYVWLPAHEEAFERIKEVLTSDLLVQPFDTKLPTELYTDASRLHGLGYMLLQREHNGEHRLISCGSRALASAETRYSTTELEALAILFAVSHAEFYLRGCPQFKIYTDHRPLIGIFAKAMADIASARIARYRERLQDYSFTLEWVPGKQHLMADALSRAPYFEAPEDVTDNYGTAAVLATFSAAAALDPQLEALAAAAADDDEYQELVKSVRSGQIPVALQAYKSVFCLLYTSPSPRDLSTSRMPSSA